LRVSDEDIGRALVTLDELLDETVEPSGAAALAAGLQRRLPQGFRRVGVILSGGNIAAEAVEGLRTRFSPYDSEDAVIDGDRSGAAESSE
jgi:threonine dehydratase